MIRALYSAGSGMTAQQMNIDNIAHNLANANTVGFKMRRAQFQDLLYQNLVQPGAAAGAQTVVPSGLQLGLGTRPASKSRRVGIGEEIPGAATCGNGCRSAAVAANPLHTRTPVSNRPVPYLITAEDNKKGAHQHGPREPPA